jgi:ABC-2 type transport system permease protein
MIQFLLFLLTLACGTFMMFHYNYVLGLISFWLIDNPFLRWHFRNVEQLFAGQFLPIWLYPGWLATITSFMPFRYFAYEPIAIYLGKTPMHSVPQVLFIQLFWMITLFLLERLMWRSAQKKVIVQGG